MPSGGGGAKGTWEALKHRPDNRQAVEMNHGRWGRSRFSDRAQLRAVMAPNDAVDAAFMRYGNAARSGVMLTTMMERLTSAGATTR